MRLPTEAQNLTEETSVQLAAQIQWVDVMLPNGDGTDGTTVSTSYVCQGDVGQGDVGQGEGTPVLLLHGFDSSLFEFRRLVPQLAAQTQTWAVDMLGFGFCDRTSMLSDTPLEVTPAAIKRHLYQFWQQHMGARPMVLTGASMGGAAAIDFALTYPEAVSKLVLLDSAGFAAGPAMGWLMVPPVDRWATAFLRNPGVRRRISLQAYHDPSWVTPDADLCAALHVQLPQWQEALIAFTKSGGYNFLSRAIGKLEMPTLVLWGECDRILGKKDATQFERTLPNGKLVWVPDCGHVPHLEKPAFTAAQMTEFIAVAT
ncbi:MAG: alpha/beta fold hydrolase [Cyanobacteria bacterium P01_A01_bin.105]